MCALLTTAHTITGVCIAHAKTKECVGKICGKTAHLFTVYTSADLFSYPPDHAHNGRVSFCMQERPLTYI